MDAFDPRTWIWAAIENADDEVLCTVLLNGRVNVLSCGYDRRLPRLVYLSPTQDDGHEEVAVSGSSDVYPRALVKHGDDDDDVRPPSFGGRLEMLLSLLLRSHSHAQILLIVIDAAEEAVSLLVDDGRPLCRPQA
jgi:hypothetical protein